MAACSSKIMARLDASLADVATQKGAKEAPPNPTDILETILDVLRYTAVFQVQLTASRRLVSLGCVPHTVDVLRYTAVSRRVSTRRR